MIAHPRDISIPDSPEIRRVWRLARVLAVIAGARSKGHRQRAPSSALHVSPIAFGPAGVVGGGERAAYGFARAVAAEIPTTLVTTGSRRAREHDGELTVEIYPSSAFFGGQRFDPICRRFLEQIRHFDVVHVHQYRVAMSQLAILGGAALRKRTFVTDLGGVGVHFDPELAVERCLSGAIAVSDFSRRMLPSNLDTHVIPTGVTQRFFDAGEQRQVGEPPGELGHSRRRVLYVGRILRHKGVDILLNALPEGVGLDVIGRVYDEEFYALLQRLAAGRDVRFEHNASDERLAEAYSQALVTVLPSVYEDALGGHWEMPELLGCVLQESMACGTPVICSDVGGMPEVVEDGATGYVVPPNDPEALGRRIAELNRQPELRRRLGRQARERALERFTWPAIARRVVAAYEQT